MPVQQPFVPPAFRPLPPPPAGTNSKAIGSLVCGVATTMTFGLTEIPAVVLGHMAQAEIRRTGESGGGLAVSGLVLGWLSVAGWTPLLLVAVPAR